MKFCGKVLRWSVWQAEKSIPNQMFISVPWNQHIGSTCTIHLSSKVFWLHYLVGIGQTRCQWRCVDTGGCLANMYKGDELLWGSLSNETGQLHLCGPGITFPSDQPTEFSIVPSFVIVPDYCIRSNNTNWHTVSSSSDPVKLFKLKFTGCYRRQVTV